MLIPNNNQKTKLFQYANTARFAYNWVLGREKENYENGGKFISDGDLRKEFTQLKKEPGYYWFFIYSLRILITRLLNERPSFFAISSS